MEATTIKGRPGVRRTSLGVQKWCFSATTAAFLSAWGCPVLSEGLPADFSAWGIVLRENVLVDGRGAPHTGLCTTTADLRLIGTDELLGMPDHHCPRCGTVLADVSNAAQPGPADHQLESLAIALSTAIRDNPRFTLKEESVYGDFRLRVLVWQLTEAVDLFQRTAMVPPGLDQALGRFLSQLRQHGREAEHRMRGDGHRRLLVHLVDVAEKERRASPYIATRFEADYELARQEVGAVIGADEPWITCGFTMLTMMAKLAVVAAPISAWTGGGAVPAPESRAIAVLPHALAVQLLAWSTSRPAGSETAGHRMTILGARSDEPRLEDVVRAAVSIWDEEELDLADAWRAATAACA